MRKLMRTTAFRALILWIICGSFFVYKASSSLQLHGTLFSNNKELLLKDGDFKLEISKPISYAPKQTATFLTKEVNSALVQLADHLINDPDKKLLITGLYTLQEENDAMDKGVGNARAVHLKEHLITLGADPSSIYTSAKLSAFDHSIKRRFKGIEFSIIDKSKKVNVNPMMTEESSAMINPTRIILPYYTRRFDRIESLSAELNILIERALESPDMSIVLSIDKEDEKAKRLMNALYTYIEELTYGVDIKLVKDISDDETVSDKEEQNIKIDIGLKRFQNNLEFLGS